MSFEIEGKLHKKYDTKEVNDRFKKREFVLSTDDGGYQQYIKLQLTQDRCSAVEPFEEGTQLKVSFNIKGNEYTNPSGEIIYFTNLNAWKIEKVGEQKVAETSVSSDDFPAASDEPSSESYDDLPF